MSEFNFKMFDEAVGPDNARNTASQWAVAPANAEECAAVLRICEENNLTVAPVGGGTKLGWGNPLSADVMLETRRMTGVRDHSWGDLTATVGAGTTWAAMQQVLAQHGQRVALDPLWPETATIGGIVAVNDSGAMRLRYGSLRDLIIGMTVVLPDGTIARSGGKVVKNVAGYDLHKLMTGAFGTLGVITEVTFRLHPIERVSETWTVRSTSAEVLGTVLLQVLNSTLGPSAMQLRSDADGFALDVQFGSLPEGLIACATRLKELAGTLECIRASDDVWLTRAQAFANSDAVVAKLTLLPTKIGSVLAGLPKTATCVIDAVGVGTLALQDDVAQAMGVIKTLRTTLAPSGGSVVVLQATSTTIDRWGQEPAAIAVMRVVKQQFDPTRMLNPGRFVGGI